MATIYGTKRNDDLFGDVWGYAEDDIIYGYAGDDLIDGGYWNDDLYGGNGNDTLYGYYGDDILFGDAGNDTLNGEAGWDDLYGGAGADNLSGGSGEDWLSGGAGKDNLWGGSESDVFAFTRNTSGITTATADVIRDWNAANDWVDMPIIGTARNYRETSTSATSIEAAAALAESTYTDPRIAHVFLYNSSTDTGYLLSDLNNDDRFETGVVLRNAGFASDFDYSYIV